VARGHDVICNMDLTPNDSVITTIRSA